MLKYVDAGRLAEAIALYEPTLKLCETTLSPDHSLTFMCRHNLANAYKSAGRLAEAIALHEVNVHAKESTLGPEHPDTLDSRDSLALAYEGAGRLADAIAMHEVILPLRGQARARPPAHLVESQQSGDCLHPRRPVA